ncbi:MAG: TIGR02757 family protein [Bacteroidales bacterium]|nr:TIGR02757 family protein [Bacteroidales bacterium]MCF8457857.1 TIGR02757 family protein [Bacteroidales bacterium]
MEKNELKDFLDEKYYQYNTPDFVVSDPIQVPHSFSSKEDIEIAAFLSASIAWGQRKTIIKNAFRLMAFMDNQPYQFILNAEQSDLSVFDAFVHRTFNREDCRFFIRSLQNMYKNHGGLEQVFTKGYSVENSVESALEYFRTIFLEEDHQKRSEKHVANILKNSSAKRLNMFLMWMVRKDGRGVHFGLWDKIDPARLYLPLDVHTGNVGRKLGILSRQQNDWKAVLEITQSLRTFDPTDPVKYDFALFGLGIFEGF